MRNFRLVVYYKTLFTLVWISMLFIVSMLEVIESKKKKMETDKIVTYFQIDVSGILGFPPLEKLP